ncbi:MAG TPA: hypothetical protein VHE56_04095 [Mycobacteriales bacterium]|nr:hypothetical protein [Mycobacteriales bacterium]
MILAIFLVLLAVFVIVPVVGYAIWTMFMIAVTGIVLGVLARLIVPGRQPIGVLATIVSGWFGSIIGGLIGLALWGKHGHWFPRELIDVGVAAISVVVFSAALRHDQKLYAKAAPRSHQGHKVIDV